MNAELLLRHFDRIADAPDAVPRLRRFILDLAVRGKLVPQDPRDEPAAEFLKHATHPHPKVDSTSLYELPGQWRWINFGVVHQLVRGVSYSQSDVSEVPTPDHYPLLRANNIGSNLNFDELVYVRKECVAPEQLLRRGDFLIALSSGSKSLVGKAAFVASDYEYGFGAFCGVLRMAAPELEPYVGVFLASSLYRDAISAGSRGIGINNLKKQTLNSLAFPLPPLAEQRRIVAKVDELMALCDRLQAARDERERGRDRLVSASLARLNQPAGEPGAFREHARFTFAHLPRLTTRVEHVKQLRQTILNLAVRGRLVEQDPGDEPASGLLKRIEADQGVQSQDSRVKVLAARHAPESLPPLHLPDTWKKVKLQTICQSIADGDHLPPPKTENGIPFLVIGDVRWGTINFSTTRFVSEEYYEGLDMARKPKKGDILYTLVGSFGIPVVVETDRPFSIQRHIGILRPSQHISVRYLAYALQSQFAYFQAARSATGIAQKTVPLSGLRKLLVPLPPLTEQRRIVAKIDELMALCDQLEAQIAAGEREGARLLDAVLHEALVPA